MESNLLPRFRCSMSVDCCTTTVRLVPLLKMAEPAILSLNKLDQSPYNSQRTMDNETAGKADWVLSFRHPVSTFPASLFNQPDRPYRDALLNRLTHIVQRQARNCCCGQCFHLDTCFALSAGNAPDLRPGIDNFDRHIEVRQSQRMA